jgi:hypothetical protein
MEMSYSIGIHHALRQTSNRLPRGTQMNLKSVISATSFFTLALMITIFNVVKAEEQIIANVTADNKSTSYKLVIDVRDGRNIKNFYKDVYEGNNLVRRELLDSSLMLNTGMVLEQRDSHVVMRLKSLNFDNEQGGIVVVDTLFNGVTGERKGYEIQIAKSLNGWSLFSHGKSINNIQIQTNRVMLIGEVGIKNLLLK